MKNFEQDIQAAAEEHFKKANPHIAKDKDALEYYLKPGNSKTIDAFKAGLPVALSLLARAEEGHGKRLWIARKDLELEYGEPRTFYGDLIPAIESRNLHARYIPIEELLSERAKRVAAEAEVEKWKDTHYEITAQRDRYLRIIEADEEARNARVKQAEELSDALTAERARSEKLRDSIAGRIKWMENCRDAAFSNMEGADAKEFEYWQQWMNQCEREIQRDRKILASTEAPKATGENVFPCGHRSYNTPDKFAGTKRRACQTCGVEVFPFSAPKATGGSDG